MINKTAFNTCKKYWLTQGLTLKRLRIATCHGHLPGVASLPPIMRNCKLYDRLLTPLLPTPPLPLPETPHSGWVSTSESSLVFFWPLLPFALALLLPFLFSATATGLCSYPKNKNHQSCVFYDVGSKAWTVWTYCRHLWYTVSGRCTTFRSRFPPCSSRLPREAPCCHKPLESDTSCSKDVCTSQPLSSVG